MRQRILKVTACGLFFGFAILVYSSRYFWVISSVPAMMKSLPLNTYVRPTSEIVLEVNSNSNATQISGINVTHLRNDVPIKNGEILFPPSRTYFHQGIAGNIPSSAQKKLIVVLNHPPWLYPTDPDYQKVFSECPYTCNMTNDLTLLSSADAVWVKYDALNFRVPPQFHRPPNQIWVACSTEPPIHLSRHCKSPAWSKVFNWTFGYRRDSDIFWPYGEFKLLNQPPTENFTHITLNKSKPISWFVSNCHSQSGREKYVNELKKYINVDMYGGCGPLKCPRGQTKCRAMLNSTYFFYLAFENSNCQDYFTEKLFKMYNLNVIPVVRGGANYSRYLPPNTYVDAANFSSPKELALYLKGLMKDVDAYTGMLRAKSHFSAIISLRKFTSFCKLCKMLQQPSLFPKVYPNIYNWTAGNTCW